MAPSLVDPQDGLLAELGNETRRGGGHVSTLHGWCDSEYGWGPTVPEGSALTMCFCATVLDLPSALLFLLYGIPRLAQALREHPVKPAFSYKYYLKLFCTVACMFCAILLALLADPPSPALRLSLTIVSLSWFLALALLVVGYYRHLPQFTCLRIWWVGQFAVNAVVFLMHAELHTEKIVHEVRGLYCAFCVLLALFSTQPEDQPRYSAVVITPPRSASPHVRGRESAATISTPLLVPGVGSHPSGHYTTWGSLDGAEHGFLSSSAPTSNGFNDVCFDDTTDSDDDPRQDGTLRRKLSSNLLISGATKSRFKKPLMEWNRLLYGSGERNSMRGSPSLNEQDADAESGSSQ